MQPAPAAPATTSGTSSLLSRQLNWIVSLRWIAGIVVFAGGLVELMWLHRYGTGRDICLAGAFIMLYNVLFWWLGGGGGAGRDGGKMAPGGGEAHWIIWGQMLADLGSLTVLVKLTGGYESPLRGLFVLHMVFASLLLPGAMALGIALVAIGMVEGVLAAGGENQTVTAVAMGAGWDLTMLATVYLASRVARDMRRQGRRLARRNARIRQMAARLKRQQEAMLQAEKMFALGQMAAGVAHEVANPLASMDGLMQLMERRPEKITAENMARLREQIARINTIVRQLTTFSRPGGNSEAEEWRSENLNTVVTRALEVLRFDSRLKKVAVDQSLDPAIVPIRMLPAAIEQVIINLVINAADAMEEIAEPRLVVRTTAIAGDSNQGPGAELIVSDNGHGMSEAVRARIFEPFYTTKAVGKGTGLGLSISYGLIQKHHGDISVDSVPNQGATFRIRLHAEPA